MDLTTALATLTSRDFFLNSAKDVAVEYIGMILLGFRYNINVYLCAGEPISCMYMLYIHV